MNSKKLILSTVAVALLSTGSALAHPCMHHSPMPPTPMAEGPRTPYPPYWMPAPPPPCPPQMRPARAPEKLPDEIKALVTEHRTLKKDIRLELCKSAPDKTKVLEMLKRAEELHAKISEWRVQQILDGKAPKPDMRCHMHHGKAPEGPRPPFGPEFRPPMPHCPCCPPPMPPHGPAGRPPMPPAPSAEPTTAPAQQPGK